ncbi:MAG: response regulator [Gemmatimonadota bacterium]
MPTAVEQRFEARDGVSRHRPRVPAPLSRPYEPFGPPPGDEGASAPDRRLFDAFPDGALRLDGEGRVVAANPAAEFIFNTIELALVGRNVDELVVVGPAGTARPPLSSFLLTDHWDGPQRFDNARGFRAKGAEFPCELALSPIEEQGNRQWLAIFRETSRRLFHESQVRESAKMHAVATLAAGIANDFNNALAAVSGSIESARLSIIADQRRPPNELLDAKVATRGAARLVRRLLNFARPAPSFRRPLDPQAVMEEAVAVLRRDLDPGVTIISRFDHGGWRVKADAEQIADLLVSLGLNSLDAMPGNGVLTISSIRTTAGAWSDVAPGGVAGREYVRLDVRDTGCGIPADVLPRIFDPFFTTKEAGQGSGLGLSMVSGVLRQHDGGITVESALGAGTTFQIFLPRTLEHSPAEPPASEAEPGSGTGTILLVDDEIAVRRPVRQALEYCGYTVLEAQDGIEALQVFGRECERIDLVLLDVKMPRMSGWEVLSELKQRVPSLPVVLTSGYSCEDSEPPVGTIHPDAFLNKPYELRELTRAIRKLIGTER